MVFLILTVLEIGAAETTTLTVWNSHSAVNVIPTLNELNKKFEEENPNIKVEMTTLPWEVIEQKLSVALASGTQPDVCNLRIGTVRTLGDSGYLAPIDDVVEFVGEDNFFAGYQSYHKVGEHYYGICQLISPTVNFYRGDLLEKHGLTIPTNWEELLDAAKKLNNPPDVYGFAFMTDTDARLSGFFASNGSYILDEKGEVIFDSQETREVLNFLKELAEYCPPGVVSYSFPDLSNGLAEGRLAMGYHFMDFLTDFAKKFPDLIDDLKAGPLVPNEGKEPVSCMFGAGQAIFKGKNIDAAKEYLKFLLREDNMIYFFHQSGGGWLPPIKSVFNKPEFWEAPPYSTFPNVYKSIVEATELAKPPLMFLGPVDWAGEVQGSNAIVSAVQQVLGGQEDVDQVVKDAQKILEEVVVNYKKQQ